MISAMRELEAMAHPAAVDEADEDQLPSYFETYRRKAGRKSKG
jgi:hypothetical protein